MAHQSGSLALLSGVIRVGSVPEFGRTVLVDTALEFQRRHPKIRISVTLLDTALLLYQLLEGRIELALMDDGPHLKTHSQIHAEPVFSERLVMTCSKKFYEAHIHGDHSFKRLSTLDCVPYHSGQEAVYKWFIHHFGKVPPLKFRISVDQVGGVIRAVKAGAGMGVVPLHLVEAEVSKGSLRVIDTSRTALVSQVVAVQLKDRVPARKDKAFIEALREAYRPKPG